MVKRKLDARNLLNDIRGGLDDTALMRKYRISALGLQSLFSKLSEARLIEQADLDKRMLNFDKTVELTMIKCPSCGMPQFSAFDECPQCGVIVTKYLKGRESTKGEIQKIVEKQPQIEPTLASKKQPVGPKTIEISAFLWEELKSLGGSPDEHVARALSVYVHRKKKNPQTE